MKKLLLGVLFFLPFFLQAQIITTFAGGGTTLGDGGPATASSIGYFAGIAFDSHGNLYIADGNHNRIRIVNPGTGIITTFAGDGIAGFSGDGTLATNAELNTPTWVAVDLLNNVYITDAVNNRIRKVDALTSVITTVAGNGSTLYASDNILATDASFGAQGIAVDLSGNLFIVDADNQRIRKVDGSSGIISTIAGNGISGFVGDGTSATTAEISGPFGICVDRANNIYIDDRSNSRIRKIDVSGIITTVAGNGNSTYSGDEIPATAAQLDPFAIALDDSGNLVVADFMNSRIRKIDHAGTIHTIAGNGIAGFSGDGTLAMAAEISFPEGVTYDLCGNLFIADFNNKKVRKVAFDPMCNVATLNAKTVAHPFCDLNIYPNPTNDLLQIDNIAVPTNYQVRTVVGVSVLEGTLRQGSNSISLKALPAGMYLLELVGDDGGRVVRRGVKSGP